MPHQPTLDDTTRLEPQDGAPDPQETARLGGGAGLPLLARRSNRPAVPPPDGMPPPVAQRTDPAAQQAGPQQAGPQQAGPQQAGPQQAGPQQTVRQQPAQQPAEDASDEETERFQPVADLHADPPHTAGGGGPARPAWWRRRSVLVPAAAVAVLGAAYGTDLLLSGDDVPRHIVVGGIEIGGLSPSAAQHTLQQRLAPRIAADRTVVAGNLKATVSPRAAGLRLDVAGTVRAVDHQPLNPVTRLVSLFSERNVAPVIATDSDTLSGQLDTFAEQVDQAPVEATITIDGTSPHVVEPEDGLALDRRASAAALTTALQTGDLGPIRLPVRVAHPHVTAATAQQVLDRTVTPALSGPVDVAGPTGARHLQIPATAIAASLSFTPKPDGTLAVAVDPAKLQAALGPQLAAFGAPAKDARFEVVGNAIHMVPSVDGTGLDPVSLAQQLLPVLERTGQRSVTAQLGPVKAAFTTEQAQALGITEKVSSFTTRFTMSPSATNIRVVAEKVNGALVKPGATFSLNDFTGPRGTAQGYVPANVIEGGQLTTAVGGGISQFATTMFNAEFFAGVQDIHHKTHSFYISRYPAGREATVFDGLIDLVWKNDSDTGIYVQTQWVSGGSLTVTFWGTKHYDIESISGDRRNVTQPSVQDKIGDDKCIPQSGAAGFDITVTRVFHDLKSGAVLRKENFNTHYIPEAIIHCLPAPPAPAPAPAPGG